MFLYMISTYMYIAFTISLEILQSLIEMLKYIHEILNIRARIQKKKKKKKKKNTKNIIIITKVWENRFGTKIELM